MIIKRLYLYIKDEEYSKQLLRYLKHKESAGFIVERITADSQGEGVQRAGRQNEKLEETGVLSGGFDGRDKRADVSGSEFYLTDDAKMLERYLGISGTKRGSGKGTSKNNLMVLAEDTDVSERRVGYCSGIDRMYIAISQIMELKSIQDADSEPERGIYGLFSPWGEEGSVCAALLSQELSAFGKCLYVNMSAFPHFYVNDGSEDTGAHLGEMFFRLGSDDFSGIMDRLAVNFGSALRLPGTAHYRDLQDISDDELKLFFRRLSSECGISYVVVLLGDVRGAMTLADSCNMFFFTSRRSAVSDPEGRWNRYALTEGYRDTEGHIKLDFPEEGYSWAYEMERDDPKKWLDDPKKKAFIRGIWQNKNG
ncbi:MAG: hypothetical protein J6P16_07155 [Eubacterium sp.]|nr:hypothetical protein [Eubacterium sp.]